MESVSKTDECLLMLREVELSKAGNLDVWVEAWADAATPKLCWRVQQQHLMALQLQLDLAAFRAEGFVAVTVADLAAGALEEASVEVIEVGTVAEGEVLGIKEVVEEVEEVDLRTLRMALVTVQYPPQMLLLVLVEVEEVRDLGPMVIHPLTVV